jgi:hypothetical protein
MLTRHLICLLCFMGFVHISNAQITQINPYYGITLPMPLKTYYGEFNTDGGNNFGLNVSFGHWTSQEDFTRNLFIELQYNYHKSPLTYYYYYSGPPEDLGDLKMHNALLGVLKGAGNEIFEGYAGVYGGVTIFDVEDPEAFDYTRFTVAAGAGIKYYPILAFGIRFHTQLNMPMWASNTYMDWSGGETGTISSIMTPYMNFNLGIFANIDRTY